ncbi:hypothetical protein J2046_006612 [Rhizobium petrolearium]|uniref:DUF2285 domain-containing protein n=2 Tax=Neorhizobium TaxID=1525371 RepID=A0ABV0MCI9_9HYPH|nr:DUF2285 domain-containing protein [Neorhizobium petrolearium]MBP1848321.1 hypothetical protein [Neorhizobium petrolearium]MCC2614541.1 DUF2285 domain-containing protein [Neorhizobium petrolearium]WGI72300.1 DUF2285 domain-containing protein [Neorhizobium petrolearium]
MSERDVEFADEVPWSEDFTDYDWQHRVAYIRLLDAKADGADWEEAARIILHRDTEADRERSFLCWESHMQRAEWMTHTGYKHLLGDGHRFDRRFFH